MRGQCGLNQSIREQRNFELQPMRKQRNFELANEGPKLFELGNHGAAQLKTNQSGRYVVLNLNEETKNFFRNEEFF